MSKITRTGQGVPAVSSTPSQYDLFTEFFGDAAELSNTIELWDAIPKYFVSKRQQSALRDEKGGLKAITHTFRYQKLECSITIRPFKVIDDEGNETEFFPSADEELVAEVIRKIFADQSYGQYDPSKHESTVYFTIYMIRKELKARGKSRSFDEIRRSIDILGGAQYTFQSSVPGAGGRKRFTILQGVEDVTRDDYLGDDKTRWKASFPPIISDSLRDLTYRQFNYGTLMGLRSPLARWVHKRLSHNYVNADYTNKYGMLYSTAERDSGLLKHKRPASNFKTLEKALDDLVSNRVLQKWERETEKRGDKNALEDVCYQLYPDREFVKNTKAANARRRDAADKLVGRKSLPSRGRKKI